MVFIWCAAHRRVAQLEARLSSVFIPCACYFIPRGGLICTAAVFAATPSSSWTGPVTSGRSQQGVRLFFDVVGEEAMYLPWLFYLGRGGF